jgi:hypothetical protein
VSRYTWWHLFAAAAVVVLVAGASYLAWQSRRTPLATGQASRQKRQWTPPDVFRLQKPAVRQPNASDLVLRGSRESTTQEDLTRAFESYAKNDYAEAARRFRAAAVRFPQSPTVHFYLGVSGLFLQHDAEAVSALETAERFAIADTPLRRQIEWYLALAYRRTNQIEQARVRLGTLCATRNEFAGRACTGLRELAGPITLSGTVTRTDGVPLSGVKVAELAVQMVLISS